MAANLKNNPGSGKKDEQRPAGVKPEKERFSPDWKWVALGLGFACTSIGATFLGVHFYVQNFLVKEKTRTEYVEKLPPKPGPTQPLFTTQIANLKGGRFLRYSVVLQFAANEALWPAGGGGAHGSSKLGNPIEKFEPLMKDVVVATVSKHTAVELLEPNGREALKGEIMRAINSEMIKVYGGGNNSRGDSGEESEALPEVLRVFFTEFVVS